MDYDYIPDYPIDNMVYVRITGPGQGMFRQRSQWFAFGTGTTYETAVEKACTNWDAEGWEYTGVKVWAGSIEPWSE